MTSHDLRSLTWLRQNYGVMPFNWKTHESPVEAEIRTTITAEQFTKLDRVDDIWSSMLYGPDIREKIRVIFSQLAPVAKIKTAEESKKKIENLQREVTQCRSQIQQLQNQINYLTKQVLNLRPQSKPIEDPTKEIEPTKSNKIALFR